MGDECESAAGSEDDIEHEEVSTGNYILAQFVTRKRVQSRRWRYELKDGVCRIDDVEYAFNSGLVEMSW